MKIESKSRPWIKQNTYGSRYGDRSYYQSSEWKKLVDFIWTRDRSMCQMCLEKGIKHYLERGTSDRTKQGTVDHKKQRVENGGDDPSNLWLIGTNHHDAKSAIEKNEKYRK